MEKEGAIPSEVPARKNIDLGAVRTAMAASRSLMAWVRTGLSLIGFGFTIYKFLESLESQELSGTAPRNLGLFLIAIGTTSLLFGGIEYWYTVRELHRDYGVRFKVYPLIVAVSITALGVSLFVGIFLRTM